MIGVINGFEFSPSNDFGIIQYYLVTPVCILFLSTSLSHSKERIEYIWQILMYLTCLLAILDVLRVVLNLMGITPSFISFIELSSEVIRDGELTLRVKNESSFFFLLPIYIYMLFNTSNRKHKKIYLLTTIFGTIYAILSGRKMLELEIVFSFFFAISYKRNLYRDILRNSRVLLSTIAIVSILSPLIFAKLSELIGVDNLPQLMLDTVINGLSSDSTGMTKRVGNTGSLFSLWSEAIIFGNGINSYAVNSLAGAPQKWSYEVFYVAWLAQTGIIGMILLVGGELSIIKQLNRLGTNLHDRRYYAVMLGFICFIIAGASNPLLYFVWPWTIAMIYCSYRPEPLQVSNSTPQYENNRSICRV